MKQTEFIHALSNKLVAVSGKTRRLRKKDHENPDLEKLERYVNDALKLLKDYKLQLTNGQASPE